MMLFCNIGWMGRYEGLVGKPDKIVGGGKWVAEHKTGHEVCNFLACGDGYVYGHLETAHGKADRNIRIETIGGIGDFVDGIDVIWTATDPDERGRKVVGWYRNATVFRQRQQFSSPPSKQHRRDEVTTYRIRALADDVRRLDLDERTLTMGRGPGWMGHTPWWVPSDDGSSDVLNFVRRTRSLLDGRAGENAKNPDESKSPSNSPSAASDAYSRYVEAYEVLITPRHSTLQTRFEHFLSTNGASELRANVASVDLRYRDAEKGAILAEIKPCERESARYAIRTAMGQLLDYRQRAKRDTLLLIVIETKPTDEDRVLATSNGFGIAYPVRDKFEVFWPSAMNIEDPAACA